MSVSDRDEQTEETASEEVEDEEEEEEEEESESDEDDVQITIAPIQPTAMPYGRTQSYTRMTIPPGGKQNIFIPCQNACLKCAVL